jgi:UDP-2,3-diacylglucosamine pyrophosphatase LpxH
MRIASFSDIHLGPAPNRDKFRHKEDVLLRFCEHVQTGHDRVILVGDVFQADWGRRIGPQAAEVDATRARYARLWALWSSLPYVLLRGNHDHVTAAHLGALSRFEVEANEVRVLYVHGDEFDVTLRGIGPHLTMWVVGRLRNGGAAWAADWIEDSLLQGLNDVFSRGDSTMRAVPGLRAERAVDVVVAGHTHKPRCEVVRGVAYANSGATKPGALTYASVDTEARTVGLWRYDDTRRKADLVSEVRIAPPHPPGADAGDAGAIGP